MNTDNTHRIQWPRPLEGLRGIKPADLPREISGGGGSAVSTPGLIVYRFTAPLYFANANLFSEEIQKLVTQAPTPVRWVVLDSSAIHDMDTTGEEAMRQVLAMLAERDVTFAVSRCSTPLQSILNDYGLLDEIGKQRFYDTNRDAVAAFRREWS